MNPRSFLLACALMAAGLGSLVAADPIAPSGVTLTLSTSGVVFGGPPPTAVPVSAAAGVRNSAVAVPPSFTAAISLWNQSANDLAFMFPSAVSAERHFVFSLFDSSGALLWRSIPATPAVPTATIAPGAVVQGVLLRGATWKWTQVVPLIIDGKPLAAGTYALEGSIDGTPVFGSRAAFQILESLPTGSGVKGTVLAGPVSPVARPGVPNEKPVPKAIIRYFNAIAANAVVTTIMADEQGRFQFAAPPGQYVVTAIIPGDENTPFGHGTKTIPVTADHFTEVTFHLDTGIR
ncbi:MAG TPA: hypothetical protein VGO11_02030 [Chthoniobacteraceae bacterium]|jgi:hypothetical protein|nr:hypothetical protein [Chthoniobacteraceae bacterium]